MLLPEDERNGMRYHILNILKPISDEYHAKFDFDHLQVMVVEIKEVDYDLLLSNLAQMLSKFVMHPLQQERSLTL
jgi:hypothetical protein